jgi:hypothetical protein
MNAHRGVPLDLGNLGAPCRGIAVRVCRDGWQAFQQALLPRGVRRIVARSID